MDLSAPAHPSGTSLSTNEFLTFTLGKEEYGMPILNVQEIRGYDAVTTLALLAGASVVRLSPEEHDLAVAQRQRRGRAAPAGRFGAGVQSSPGGFSTAVTSRQTSEVSETSEVCLNLGGDHDASYPDCR